MAYLRNLGKFTDAGLRSWDKAIREEKEKRKRAYRPRYEGDYLSFD